MAIFIYYYSDLNIEVPEKATIYFNDNSVKNTSILLVLGTMLWIAITAMLAFGSVVCKHRLDMIESTNQIFGIDDKQKRHFPHVRLEDSRMSEGLMNFICYFTISLPFILLLALFHPGYPIRSLFQIMFELPATVFTPLGWVIIIKQTYGVNCFCGEAVCLLTINNRFGRNCYTNFYTIEAI